MDEDRTLNEDFVAAEEKEMQKQLQNLTDQAHEGALFSDWSRSFCTREMFKWLDEQIQDSKNNWISATSQQEAEAIRLQAQSYTKIKNWVLSKVRTGDVAAVGVRKFHEEGIELQGLIKPPPAK